MNVSVIKSEWATQMFRKVMRTWMEMTAHIVIVMQIDHYIEWTSLTFSTKIKIHMFRPLYIYIYIYNYLPKI